MTELVAVVVDTDAIGGAERFVADLISGMNDARWQFVVLGNASPSLEAWITRETAGRAKYLSINLRSTERSLAAVRARVNRFRRAPATRAQSDPRPIPHRHFDMFAPHRLPHDRVLLGLRAWHAVVNVCLLQRAFRQISPDIVHVNNGGYPGAASARVTPIAARLAGISRVINFVHQYAAEPRIRRRTERLIDRVIDRCSSRWYTAAIASSKRLGAVRAIAAAKISTVYLGQQPFSACPGAERGAVSVELAIPSGRFVLAQIGILWRRKGQAVSITALELLMRRHLDVHLVLIGDGEDRYSLAQLARQLGVLDRVTFTGFRTDVPNLLGAVDLVINPSVEFELLPYSIKEAMAAGLPVVATDVGGTRELVRDRVTGILVAPNDATALADSVAELIDAPGLRASMGGAGRARIERCFSMQAMLDAMSAAYDDA